MTGSNQPLIALGQSAIRTVPLGVGTWAWGEKRFWAYGQSYGEADIAAAFAASVAAGVTLFDTAEIYGRGESERLVGKFARQTTAPTIIATKYMPFPWRFQAKTVHTALTASLQRLGLSTVDLYQIHAPFSLIRNQTLMDALADLVAEGAVRAVGVSNYNAPQTQRAHEALARRGVPLATNQIQYSLLHRQPETNGTLASCRDLGVTVLAYSPLAQGLLTGKYHANNRPTEDIRSRMRAFQPAHLKQIGGLLDLLRGIGEDHGGKTVAQVALNWLIQQTGVVPIPGAKNADQATSNAEALGWALRPEEVAALARASNAHTH